MQALTLQPSEVFMPNRLIVVPVSMALVLFALDTEAIERTLDLRQLAALPDDAGRIDYYQTRSDDRGVYVHAEYRPGLSAVKRGITVPMSERRMYKRLSWRWRALTLPIGGDECRESRTDSAASIYVGWRRGLRWYGLKYAWSSVGRLGAVCDRKRNPFVASDTIILETGGPSAEWLDESIDLDREFRAHFAEGDPHAEVPDLIGIAILTDGDQTQSASSADFGGFVLSEGTKP
jgi:hypothetical protein